MSISTYLSAQPLRHLTRPFYGFVRVLVSVSLPILLLFPTVASASVSPLSNRNLHPLKLAYSAAPIRCCTGNEQPDVPWRVEIQHDIANASHQEQTANETLLVDAEINRTEVHATYQWQQALGDRKRASHRILHQLGVAVPWISLSGGGTDSAISNWHDWFGLPNGNRDSRPDNALRLHYQRDGQTLADHSNAISGLGDLDVYWQSSHTQREKGTTNTLYLGASIPLDNRSFISSDALQLQGHWGWYSPPLLANTRLFGRLGAQYAFNGGFLKNHRKDLAGFATLGGSAPIWRQLVLVAQWELQSRTYESDLDSLGSSSSQLTIGLQSPQRTGFNWSLYFTEDTDVNSAPDFGIGLKIGYTP